MHHDDHRLWWTRGAVALACILLVSLSGIAQQYHRMCGTEWSAIDPAVPMKEPAKRARLTASVRPVLQTSLVSPSGRFRIHFDTSTANQPSLIGPGDNRIPGTALAFVDSIATAFDRSWESIVRGHGYDPPPQDVGGGDGLYDVYIMDLSPELFGETQFADVPFQTSPNSRYETWILIDNDFSSQRTRGLDGARVTAAHEYFHAVQIGAYGFWGSSEAYWYELTATWMEDEVFPDVDDYLFEVSRYMTAFRTTSFTEYSSVFPGYERVLFAHFMSEQYGRGSVRSVWEHMRSDRVIPALQQVFTGMGTSLQTAFGAFAKWNFFTSDRADTLRFYKKGWKFPRLDPIAQTTFVGQESSVSYGFSPLSHGLFAVRLDQDTLFIMLTNTDVDAAVNGGNIPPIPAIVLSRSAQSRPSQRLALGLTGGLAARDPHVWDIEYFSSGSGTVARRSQLDPFPNPWDLSGPFDLVIPTSEDLGKTVDVYLISADFRSVSAGPLTVREEKGSSAIRIIPSNIRDKVGSGPYAVVVRTSGGEELSKIVIIK